MNIEFHKSLGGVSYIDKIAAEKGDRAILLLLIKELIVDTEMTLEVSDVKKLKGFKEKVYEIRKKDYRIFYIIKDDIMVILDIIKKKKNNTEKRYIDTLKKRIKTL